MVGYEMTGDKTVVFRKLSWDSSIKKLAIGVCYFCLNFADFAE